MAHHLILPDLQAPVPPPPPVFDFFRSQPGDALPDGIGDTTKNITHQGGIGVLTGINPIPGALDVNAPVILHHLNIGNQPVSTTLAASVVDTFSTIIAPQTTAGVSLTLPIPTFDTTGRLMNVMNSGTVMVRVAGSPIAANTGRTYQWNNGSSTWVPLAQDVDFWRSVTPNPPFIDVRATPDSVTDTTDTIVHEGSVSILYGSAITPIVPNSLDINAKLVYRSKAALVNIPVDGPIGTAALTVDSASFIPILQLTPGRTFTIPDPTANTVTGHHLVIANISSVSFDIITAGNFVVTVSPGQHAMFIWHNAVGGVSPNVPATNTGRWYSTASPALPSLPDFFRTPSASGVVPDGVNDVTEQIVHTGDIGVGLTGATTPIGKLDIFGSLVTRSTNSLVLGANGPITTTAIIDVTSYLDVQGALNGAYTIPPPTVVATGGRRLIIANFGINTFTVNTVSIPPSTIREFVWDIAAGGVWIASTSLPSADFFRSGSVNGALPDGVTDMADTIYHTGDVGLGHTGAQTAPIGTVTIRNKGLVLFPGTVTNQAANFTIPAATIDVASTLLVAQTTAGIVFTLSAPTDATSQGRVLRVLNSGSAAFTILDTVINPGKFGDFVWQGAGTWSSQAGQAGNVQKFRVVQALVVGANVVAHNLALANFAAVVDVRDNATGATIAVSITAETTNSVTITVAGAVAAGRITVLG